jgi:recombination protein RecA
MAKKKEESNESVLESLEKKYGMWRPDVKNLIVVSTGSLKLDQAMHIGGTPVGKMIELIGYESSGKSTVCLHQIAEYQKAFPDKKAVIMDFEHSMDIGYAESVGVDIDNLLIYQPSDSESGYDMVLALIEADIASCVVIDSQTAAIPKAVREGEMSDATIGLQARINSKFCMKVKGLLDLHQCTLFFISQIRDKIGSFSGEATTTTGGHAIKFYSDVRWKMWKTNDKEHESNMTTIDVIKSKVGKPFGQAKVAILWGKGFDKVGEVIDYAIDFEIMKRGGSWYSYGDTKIGQGLDNVKTLFDDNPELYEEIRNKVLEKLNDNS